MNAEDEAAEVQRLANGPDPGAHPDDAETMHLRVRCGRNAHEVLHRTRELLLSVLRSPAGSGTAELRAVVPEWFREACAPEETAEQEQARAERRRALSPAERLREVQDRRWSLESWLQWFTSKKRLWCWWDAQVRNPNALDATVLVLYRPAPVAALDWAFRAAGANAVEIDD